ncbi:hypothetical protein H0A36_00225 [Endozoicomonas sp. SM1973]|uniref:Uncharacterized protein n=1 Tax=Spartinivicinus marinus TaxID=2994442 RepID=A0A853I396_9GAMM|nr:hypothetical protein [Spartinivicinus marinus]MCX4026574.1 hypothetical protein [Spartinivicinus marinus]NYZ64411.1 hypothetical protein [Spartinivicinus marinus]
MSHVLSVSLHHFTEADCQPIPDGGWILVADIPGGTVEISGNNRARLAEMANELAEARCIARTIIPEESQQPN